MVCFINYKILQLDTSIIWNFLYFSASFSNGMFTFYLSHNNEYTMDYFQELTELGHDYAKTHIDCGCSSIIEIASKMISNDF